MSKGQRGNKEVKKPKKPAPAQVPATSTQGAASTALAVAPPKKR